MTADAHTGTVPSGTAIALPTEQDWHEELRARRERAWRIVQDCGCDAGLVFGSPEHRVACRYLTRFEPVLGDLYGVLAGPDRSTWVMNFHWQLAEARALSGLDDWQAQFNPVPLVTEALAAIRPRRLAVVGLERLPHVVMTELVRTIPGVEIVNGGMHLDRIRRIKTPIEVALLRQAVRVTDSAIDQIRSELRVGQTETELAARITYLMHAQGAALTFPSLVMAGTDRDDIVCMPRNRAIKPGDTVMFDVGASHEGYQADIGRTFVVGRPSQAQQKAWDAVCRARDAVFALARPGTPCNDLHTTAVRILGDAGYALRHRIGHGYGLATSFEWPSLDTETAPLEPGMTLAIEPAVYQIGVGAVKCEDDVVITGHGCEVLSRASTDWIL